MGRFISKIRKLIKWDRRKRSKKIADSDHSCSECVGLRATIDELREQVNLLCSRQNELAGRITNQLQNVVNDTKEGVLVSNTAFLLAGVVKKVGIDSVSDQVIFSEDEYSSEDELDSVLGESEEEISGSEYSSSETVSEDELSKDLRSCSDDSEDEFSEGEYTSIDTSEDGLSAYSEDCTNMEECSSVEEESDDEEVASSVSHYITEESQTRSQEQKAEELGKLWEEELNKYYGSKSHNMYSGAGCFPEYDPESMFVVRRHDELFL